MIAGKALLFVLLGAFGLTTVGLWRYKTADQHIPAAQFAFLQDSSDSIPNDCGRAQALAERVMAMPEASGGATIAFFTLGSEETANEPRLLAKFEVPVTRMAMEGHRAAARKRNALLADLRSKCEEVPVTKTSPIFQAIARGVEQLRSIGDEGDYRHLFVQTDGEETADPQVKRALAERPGSKLKLPSRIQNGGVKVSFCGLAETVGRVDVGGGKPQRKSRNRDARRAERLREVWAGMFTSPELVNFEPYCSR